MPKTFDLLDPVTNEVSEQIDPTIAQSHSYALSPEPNPNLAANQTSNGCELIEVDNPTDLELWKPVEPQLCKDIAAYYEQSKRTIQKWFVDLREIAPWFADSELRLSDDRYTPLAVELLGSRYFAGSKKKWTAVLIEQFADRAETATQPTPAIQPDVLHPSTSSNPDSTHTTHSSGMRLHLGASPMLPSILGIVQTGDDTAYLLQMQQRLEAFEQLQHHAIAQMQHQYQQIQALNAQYHEATSLSDQLLLKEFQLKGVQLGYAAIQIKQQAFKSTVQAAEAGTLSTPGKPLIEAVQPQSA